MSWPVAWTVKAWCVPVEGARGQIDIALLQCALTTSSMPMLADGQGLGVELDPHGIFLRAEDLHLGHAADHGDALGHEGLGIFIDRRRGQDRRTQRQDREPAGRPD